jgi:hypothetical protein
MKPLVKSYYCTVINLRVQNSISNRYCILSSIDLTFTVQQSISNYYCSADTKSYQNVRKNGSVK